MEVDVAGDPGAQTGKDGVFFASDTSSEMEAEALNPELWADKPNAVTAVLKTWSKEPELKTLSERIQRNIGAISESDQIATLQNIWKLLIYEP